MKKIMEKEKEEKEEEEENGYRFVLIKPISNPIPCVSSIRHNRLIRRPNTNTHILGYFLVTHIPLSTVSQGSVGAAPPRHVRPSYRQLLEPCSSVLWTLNHAFTFASAAHTMLASRWMETLSSTLIWSHSPDDPQRSLLKSEYSVKVESTDPRQGKHLYSCHDIAPTDDLNCPQTVSLKWRERGGAREVGTVLSGPEVQHGGQRRAAAPELRGRFPHLSPSDEATVSTLHTVYPECGRRAWETRVPLQYYAIKEATTWGSSTVLRHKGSYNLEFL
ncbi:hypothetical protein J6590_018564 [Homalodisca vitripennis]|nr:hypothetical protein J6590_018564 [Homalodisca vitripennis]